MNATSIANEQYFLSGGEEMGALIRATDWSKTSLGDPQHWPESLRTMVAVMLNNPFGMYIAWGNDYIQIYNDSYRPILGTTKHPQALGISTRETFSEIWHIIGPMFNGVMKGDPVGFPDFMLPLNRNGFVEECYFDFSYSPIPKEDGQIGGVLVTVIETTEKKKAINALQESESRFRTMAEGTNILIATSNETSNATYFNKAWTDFTGRSMEDLLNFGWTDLIHTEDRQVFVDNYLDAFERQQPWVGEFRIHNKNGNYKWLLANGTPRWLNDGSFAGYISSSVDITERKEVEKRVLESEQNLRNTILQAPVAMCFFKEANHIVKLANAQMIELWGRTASEVINKPIFEALPEVKGQGFEDLLNHVFTTGETYVANGIPVTLPRGDKIETVYVNFVYAPHRESTGDISGILAVAVDVTPQVLARQRIEEIVTERTKELAEANLSLKKSNSELEQFAYIASHDLQEPLRKVSTFADMLEQSLSNIDERSQNYLNKLNTSTSRMLTLIRDVLAYSQLSKQNDIFVQVDLQKVIDIIRNDFELLIEQKGATITTTNLPKLEAIPLQMSQLFGNLVSNALKFNQPDVKPVIEIEAKILTSQEVILHWTPEPDTIYYHISCRDNGIGFNQGYASQIFNIFQRLHGRSNYTGTGIGLAICKKIVQNHHGEIFATSELQKGAAFTVILPAFQKK